MIMMLIMMMQNKNASSAGKTTTETTNTGTIGSTSSAILTTILMHLSAAFWVFWTDKLPFLGVKQGKAYSITRGVARQLDRGHFYHFYPRFGYFFPSLTRDGERFIDGMGWMKFHYTTLRMLRKRSVTSIYPIGWFSLYMEVTYMGNHDQNNHMANSGAHPGVHVRTRSQVHKDQEKFKVRAYALNIFSRNPSWKRVRDDITFDTRLSYGREL